MRFLLDANVLISLIDTDHTSHHRSTEWFRQSNGRFATCPITQGALVRYMLRVKVAATVTEAKDFLARVVALEGHEFWPDSMSFLDLPDRGITGHGQVTDAYLVLLARHFEGTLATLDRPLAAIHGDAAVLIP